MLRYIEFGTKKIGKHFTLSRADGGVDAAFSAEPAEFQALVQESERAWKSIGSIHYGVTDKEKPSLMYRRSLYVVQNMKAGDIFTKENLRAIRPGYGLAPQYYDILLGKSVKKDIERGTPVNWGLLE